jgi:hypothetical protein
MEDFMAVLISGITGVLFLGLGLPLAMRKVQPNRWYGYRVSRYQLEDDDIWYAINRKGGLHLVYAGILCLMLAAVSSLYIGKLGVQLAMLILLSVILVVFIVYEIHWSVRAAERMARDKGIAEDSEAGVD